MQSNGKRIALVYLCWCLIFQGLAFSEDIKIEAEGKASFSGRDQASARSKALEDFEKQVVTKAIVDLLGEDQYERNKNTIEKNILHKPDRYIKAYKIMGEETSEGFYKVRGEATIDSMSLKKVLSSLRLSPITPKPHKTTEESPESAVSKKEEQSTPEEKKRTQSENGEGMKTTQNLFLTYDRSCDLEIGDKNAGDLFAEILTARLSELGFTVVSTDDIQKEPPENVILKGNFICFENKIEFQMEIINNSQREHLEDHVTLDEDTPLMDALMTLAEISSNHILLILGEQADSTRADEASGQKNQPETGHSRELASQEGFKTPSSDTQVEDRGRAGPSQTLWQIVIRDPHGGLHWERLQKKLKESGKSIDVSRILISPESFTVETPELDDKTINLLESLLSKDGLNFRIDVDHQSRRVLIRSQGGQ